MNVALILAGGSGRRTEQDIPKQFLNVYDKPIIIYTLEAFEKQADIDAIMVVCLDGWIDILWAYAREYGIKKLKWVIPGGDDGHQSTENGVLELKDYCGPQDILLIHDAVRPMVSGAVISDCISVCKSFGCGLSAVRCQETIVRSDDGRKGSENIGRNEVMRVQTPQAYRFEKILWAYEEAERLGITGEVYANTLLLRLGGTVYFSKGSNKNIKITTVEDLEIFKALYITQKEEWLK